MTAFKPATPQVVPAPEAAAPVTTHGPPPVVGTPPPGAPHVPHYPKRIGTSRPALVGTPSTAPPPHLSPPQPKPLPQAKKEYAWQRNRALGKRF